MAWSRIFTNGESFNNNTNYTTSSVLTPNMFNVPYQNTLWLYDNKVSKDPNKDLSTNDFTDAYKNAVDSNTNARHTHTNKGLLDTYTQTEVNLADAVSKKHSHSNIGVLNATEKAFTTALKNKIDNSIQEGDTRLTNARPTSDTFSFRQTSTIGAVVLQKNGTDYTRVNVSLPTSLPPYFANYTWYAVGDDVAIGDHNYSGAFCVKGLNGTPAIKLFNSDDSWYADVIHSANIGSQSVNYANSAGSVDWSNVSNRPTDFMSRAEVNEAMSTKLEIDYVVSHAVVWTGTNKVYHTLYDLGRNKSIKIEHGYQSISAVQDFDVTISFAGSSYFGTTPVVVATPRVSSGGWVMSSIVSKSKTGFRIIGHGNNGNDKVCAIEYIAIIYA
jgi:hypothetical protein